MSASVNHNERETALGLDIGSNSIGWALIELQEGRPTAIIDTGVRIFNRAVEDKIPTPKNAKRRQARLARRVIQRRARRKSRMQNYLISINLLPADLIATKDREKLLNALGDPYMLRARALDQPLAPHELGRVLLHLVQRRGFLSNRKTAMGDLVDDPDVLAVLREEDAEEELKPTNEEGQFKQQIAALRDRIKDSGYRTLGEYLHNNPDLESKRNRIRNGGDLRTDRAMYRHELESIWHVQKKFHDTLRANTLETIEDIIFYQRPLKLKSDRVGKCSLETKKKRCAIARLEYQQFRYLQDVNNLAYIDPNTDELRRLTDDQRSRVLPLFEVKKNVTYPQIRKALGFDKTYQFNLERAENKKLKGNLTAISIAEILPQWSDFNHLQKNQLVEDLLTYEKRSNLKDRLERHWKLDTSTAIQLCLLEFEDGYGNLSLKAINRLLPHLLEGKIYSDARLAADYGFEQEDINLDRLPRAPTLTNPIVNRGLNEVRRLVNAIIKVYGKPAVIRLEMARDLEMNTKRYKQFTTRQKKNTQSNDEAKDKWTAYSKANASLGLRKYPTRDQKIKYRLWMDQNQRCAYSNQSIAINQLFSDDTEVDHIIPYSMSLDDSYMNKVVCFSRENRTKAQKTPIEAYGGDVEKWDQISQAIQRWDKALYSKVQRFYKRSDDLDQDFISSQLNDTRYISKEALVYVKKLGVDVTTSKGIVTSWLRHQWGLNSILSEDEQKDRSDHRQHAIDATITACLDRPFYKAMVDTAKDLERSGSSLKMNDLVSDEPWEGFRHQLVERIQTMIISHQTSSKITGSLHEETGVGFIEGLGTVYRKPVSPDLNLDSVIDPTVKSILEKHLANNGGAVKIAFSDEKPVYHKDGRTRIKRVRCIQSKTSKDKLEKNKLAITDKNGAPFKWHSFGNVHSAQIYVQDDKYQTEYQTVYAAKRRVPNKLLNRTPVAVLHKNDAVTLLVDEQIQIFRVQKISFTNRTISLIPNRLAKQVIAKDIKILTLNDATINKHQLRKASINILGKVQSEANS
jgi:CRISPR-associated endonuclease Csn1